MGRAVVFLLLLSMRFSLEVLKSQTWPLVMFARAVSDTKWRASDAGDTMFSRN